MCSLNPITSTIIGQKNKTCLTKQHFEIHKCKFAPRKALNCWCLERDRTLVPLVLFHIILPVLPLLTSLISFFICSSLWYLSMQKSSPNINPTVKERAHTDSQSYWSTLINSWFIHNFPLINLITSSIYSQLLHISLSYWRQQTGPCRPLNYRLDPAAGGADDRLKFCQWEVNRNHHKSHLHKTAQFITNSNDNKQQKTSQCKQTTFTHCPSQRQETREDVGPRSRLPGCLRPPCPALRASVSETLCCRQSGKPPSSERKEENMTGTESRPSPKLHPTTQQDS